MNVLGLEDNDCFSLNITNLGRYGHLTGRSRFFNLPVGENAFEHGDNKRECSRDNDRNNKPACTDSMKGREMVSVQLDFLPAHRLIGCFQGKKFSFHLPNYTFLKGEGIGKELAL